jgi:hypothetical protein
MKSRNKTSVTVLGVLMLAFFGLCGSVHPQEAPPPGPPGPPMMEAMGFEGFQAGPGGKTVAGAPFSATFSTQTTQSLSDGNQIQRSTTGTLARDSQGRTRRDMTLPAIGPWAAASGKTPPHVVFINDPVAAASYILQPDAKIARKMPMRQHGGNTGGAAAQSRTSNASPRFPGSQDIVTTSLGTQTLNGVTAEGTRYTRTIPAGAIGNQNPIVITTERWYSPDLQTVVMTKRSDPRMGETVTQLTNIQRTEPDAALFQVPSDYTVKQGGRAPLGMQRHHQGPPPADGGSSQPAPQD